MGVAFGRLNFAVSHDPPLLALQPKKNKRMADILLFICHSHNYRIASPSCPSLSRGNGGKTSDPNAQTHPPLALCRCCYLFRTCCARLSSAAGVMMMSSSTKGDDVPVAPQKKAGGGKKPKWRRSIHHSGPGRRGGTRQPTKTKQLIHHPLDVTVESG